MNAGIYLRIAVRMLIRELGRSCRQAVGDAAWPADRFGTGISTASVFLICAAVLVCAGCQTTLPRDSSRPPLPTDNNAELVEYISDMPYVTAEAACRAAYILAKGQVFTEDYAALVEALKSEKLITGPWNRQADEFVIRAEVAMLIARAADVRSGLNWRLTGLGRYAHRELIYLGIAHYSGEFGYISGGEFLGTLARAEDYMHNAGRSVGQRAELGVPAE